MLKTLRLTNFRQHHDLTLNFERGVSVLRGQNEAGKSTVFEAIAYALFGTPAARNNDLTSWGAEPQSHKVVLTFEVGGTTYTIKRNARSAELNYEGGRVTGQKDTARFCEDLLQLKPNTGTKLMFVPQNEMRGVLAEGGAKTTTMIEQLADLGQIDDIIEKLQKNWHTGKTDLIEQMLASLQEQFSKAEQDVKATEGLEERLAKEKAELEEKRTQLDQEAKQLDSVFKAARAEVDELQAKAAEYRTLEKALVTTEATIEQLNRQLAEPLPECDEGEVASRQADLNRLHEQAALSESYRAYTEPKVRVKGDNREEVEKVLETVETEIESVNQNVVQLRTAIKATQKQICEDLACPTCKRKFDDAAEKESLNEKLRAEIKELEEQLAAVEAQLPPLREQRKLYKQALDYHEFTGSDSGSWQLVTDGLYPPRYEWNGPEPVRPTPKALREAEEALQDANRRAALYVAKREEQERARQVLAEQQEKLAEQQKALAQFGSVPDLTAASDKLREAQVQLTAKWSQLDEATRQVNGFNEAHRYEREQRERALQAVASAKQDIEKYQVELGEARKANQLLKVLRSIKPIIANNVWQSVCNTVSHYFSLMRSQTSVVSKETSGFVVDGHDTASLSGSTLDILGLAIRVALTKTFIPACPFLLLDEPFSAADDDRTTQALGFITSLGFEQVVIITHEDMTESVADNLITL